MVRIHTTLFPERRVERNPLVVMPKADKRSGINWERETITGAFYRVIPQTPREIQVVRMLDHHVDKFAPAVGNGAIVSAAALEKFDA